MEAVITYIKGYPNKTNLTYRRIEDDVVERIVNDFKIKVKEDTQIENIYYHGTFNVNTTWYDKRKFTFGTCSNSSC